MEEKIESCKRELIGKQTQGIEGDSHMAPAILINKLMLVIK